MKIKICKLSKIIDKNIILNDVNMNLESGNIYGFVGRNGSGKTMLLKMICGFVNPSSGNILIDDESIFQKNYFNNNIRALIEKPKFIDSLSGFDNLKLLANINNTIDDNTINYWLDKIGLLDEKNKLYGKYSLGMKQKLGIIQVLMENPPIMILDEPLNGIDEKSANIVRDILLKEKENGKLILISTHIKEDIETLCNVIYKFDNGNVQLLTNENTVKN